MEIDSTTYDGPFDLFAETSWYLVERRILDQDWIADDEIAAILAANSDVPVPIFFQEFQRDRAAGKIKRKRGRKSTSDFAKFGMIMIRFFTYPDFLKEERDADRRSRGVRSGSRRMFQPQQPPAHVRAAQRICDLIWEDRPMNYQRLLNIISGRRLF